MIEHFNINFFGVINLTNAVLPHMRERRSGTILIMGSRSAFRNEFLVSVHALYITTFLTGQYPCL